MLNQTLQAALSCLLPLSAWLAGRDTDAHVCDCVLAHLYADCCGLFIQLYATAERSASNAEVTNCGDVDNSSYGKQEWTSKDPRNILYVKRRTIFVFLL